MTATFNEIMNVIKKDGMDAAEKEFSGNQEIAKIVSGTEGEIIFSAYDDMVLEQNLAVGD